MSGRFSREAVMTPHPVLLVSLLSCSLGKLVLEESRLHPLPLSLLHCILTSDQIVALLPKTKYWPNMSSKLTSPPPLPGHNFCVGAIDRYSADA